MNALANLRRRLFGKPLDPLDTKTRRHIALVAFFAWVGLGADGISSSCYGPEEAFRALGEHTDLGLYLALATAATVFIIALAYNQVIELFPTGGGGYRVATRLIGPYAGLVSGAALILDYVLTISISIASGVDALFSLFPIGFQPYKLAAEVAFIVVLVLLNLRGMKEAITVLLPIFVGFILTHAFLIVYGVLSHATVLPTLVPDVWRGTSELSAQVGWTGVAALLLLAYSQGGGTYTGIEAVSNNVNVLAEPRVHTGKVTMLYMALSLAFTAGGIILLYLLWGARPAEGQTLNAVAFGAIIESFGWDAHAGQAALWVVLALEAGLLFVAANTGFLGGPAVLSNMAADSWVPHQFRYLSTRLVTQNGILVMGLGSLVILLWTGGSVSTLVVLYSLSVFLTFAVSLFGLCLLGPAARRKKLAREAGVVGCGIPRVRRHSAHAARPEVPRRRMADGPHHRRDHCRLCDHPQPLRVDPGAVEENRRRFFGHSVRQRRQPAQTGPQPAHCGVSGGLLARRRAARAALGPAHVSGPFQELHFRQRAHGGLPKFRRARRPRGDESGGESVAFLLRQLLQQQGMGGKIIPVLRDRPHR